MLLTDIQIRRAKAQDKVYTLNDGNSLSLLIKPNGSKGWHFRYRFAGKPKMISFGLYSDVSLADARKAEKIALQRFYAQHPLINQKMRNKAKHIT